MQLLTYLTASSLALGSFAAHVLHEKRSIPSGWAKGDRLASHELLPVRIALKQSNMDKLDEVLLDVSTQESPNYGAHWDADKVRDFFSPSDETIEAVQAWLDKAGIDRERISQPISKGWLHFDASVREAESLFKSKYHTYTHEASGTKHVACEEYHLPQHLKNHIDFAIPTVHFDAQIGSAPIINHDLEKRDKAHLSLGSPNSGSLPKIGQTFGSLSSVFDRLKNCTQVTTPDCLRALYLIPPLLTSVSAQKKAPIGIVEYSPQAFVQSDLNRFFANFSKLQVHKQPVLASIDGGYAQQVNMSFNFNGESNLDLEYAMTLTNPLPVTLYQVGDPYLSGSFNNFVDALDGSYCANGGLDPTQDSIYPDNDFPDGYKGKTTCGGFTGASVISTSYGYNEADLTPLYEQRQCAEYGKLGLLGTTFVYSSGDYGVAGNGGQCIDPATGQYNNGSTGIFNPSFPGGCPYVLSVGATQVKPTKTIFQADPEEACETVIYSGGGFSNVFPLPTWQQKAVGDYYAKYNPPYGADRYNNSRKVRAFPDVSANGANYLVTLDGTQALVYGTSASAPVFAAVLATINEARALIGKGPVGYVNPTFYANPQVFNDITSGGNQGCGTPGFTAVPGWDPVTGLGTPNTVKMLALFLK